MKVFLLGVGDGNGLSGRWFCGSTYGMFGRWVAVKYGPGQGRVVLRFKISIHLSSLMSFCLLAVLPFFRVNMWAVLHRASCTAYSGDYVCKWHDPFGIRLVSFS